MTWNQVLSLREFELAFPELTNFMFMNDIMKDFSLWTCLIRRGKGEITESNHFRDRWALEITIKMKKQISGFQGFRGLELSVCLNRRRRRRRRISACVCNVIINYNSYVTPCKFTSHFREPWSFVLMKDIQVWKALVVRRPKSRILIVKSRSTAYPSRRTSDIRACYASSHTFKFFTGPRSWEQKIYIYI